MTALALLITDAGRAAIVNAQNTGTAPIVLSQVALGSGTYNPAAAPGAARTALSAEFKRLTTFGADVVAPDTLHVTITDTSADTYNLGEIGLYTNTGVLFAVYSQATPILEKGAQQLVLLSADILLTSVPPGTVTIGDTDFMLPPATTERQGIIEIATDAEVDAGTDTARAVTPAGLKRRIDTRAPTARTITAGNGLTGGGSLAADRTLALGTPSTITGSSGNAVGAETHSHALNIGVADVAGAAAAARTITAGNGLTGGGSLAADRTISLGTPSTLSGSTTNSTTSTSHTHEISAATTELRGVVELATSAEALAGTDTSRAVTPAALKAALIAAFPVGAVYITAGNTNPAAFLGGTWVQIAHGRTLMGVGTLGDDTYGAGATGGAARVTLTQLEMPAHSHGGFTDRQDAFHVHSGTTSTAGAHTHDVRLYASSGGAVSAAAAVLEQPWANGSDQAQADLSARALSAGSHSHPFTTEQESAVHRHAIPLNGGGQAHENRPPYLAVYFWQRTA